MSDREIPVESTHNVATFDILLNNEVIDQRYQVLGISIVKDLNKIPTAQIKFKDGDASNETFSISESDDFIPGKTIEIKLGRDSENIRVFKGMIIKHGIRVRENGDTELVIDCKDESYKMTIGRKNAYFENSSDSEIIEEVIRKYADLEFDVSSTDLIHKEMVQFNCSDWDFIMMRAENNGRIVMVDDGKINVTSPNTEEDSALGLIFGSTLIDFEAEMDASNQWTSVLSKSWNYGDQSLFENTIDTVAIEELGNVSSTDLASALGLDNYQLNHSGQAIGEELQEWSKSYLQRSKLSKIRGRAKFIGFSEIKPGNMIELQGLGARFNGKAYVSGIRHDVYEGTWHTHAQFGLDPQPFSKKYDHISEPGAGGLLPPIKGLQIGKVVQLQDDPDGENRILVRLPIIDNNAPGVWARVATLDAGQNRGSFFLPELDDEVIVGFLNDDPRDAIVLGMLNSSAKPAPIAAEDNNHNKGFVTRSGMRVLFNDDTKTIVIDTPAGNTISLDENESAINIKDQNDNKAVFSPTGIEMESPMDIKISATGKIDISAGTKLTMSAAQMSISAQSSMEVKGATTKLTASGPTIISGMPININ